VLLPANPACVLVQMQARTLAEAPAYRRMSRHSFGDVTMARIASVGQTVTALLDEVPARATESAQLQLVHSGELILIQGDRETRARAGELLVYDASRPFGFVYPDDFASTIVQIPTGLLGVTGGQLASLSLRPAAEGAGPLATLLRHAAQHESGLSVSAKWAISRSVVSSARVLVRDRIHGTPHRAAPHRLARLVLDYAEEHLDAPTLTAATLAHRFHVSVRTLHAAFEGERETLGRSIRRLRVQRAQQLLATTPLPVGAIAAAVGYPDATAFIRAFTSVTGVTPGRWRRGAGGAEAGAGGR
jgi:AraC-like DNA-binding protein